MRVAKNLKPLGLYIHIPFCVKKCLYCDFTSFPAGDEIKERYLSAIIQEMASWKDVLLGKYYIKTVFIGGGTPTCLSAIQLDILGNAIQAFCSELNQMLPNGQAFLSEFTIEANPGTISREKISIFQKMGVNRVSLGLQSAQDRELKALGRIHTYEDFLRSYDLLQENLINNINIDLMADIPLQTIESYEDTLQKVIKLQPQHISSYSLIVEEGTPFYRMQQQNKLLIPDEEADREMYELTQEMLKDYGYFRYEISNYAQKEKECVHNTIYWRLEDYLGLGLGASSYFSGYRFRNTEQMQEYLENNKTAEIEDSSKQISECIQLQNKKELHRLTQKEEMEEFVFLGLRMMQGISLPEYYKRFQKDFRKQYENVLAVLFEQKLLAENANHDRIYLTNRGIDVSNMVLAEFLMDE